MSKKTTIGLDRFPRWRKPRSPVVEVRPEPPPLAPEHADLVERACSVVREARLPGVLRRRTTHRKLYVRVFLAGAFLGESCAALARRHGIKKLHAWRALRGAMPILREYFTEEEIGGMLRGRLPAAWPPPPTSPGTSPPSRGGACPGPSPGASRPGP